MDEDYVFISYATGDITSASIIREALATKGISYWMAPESISIAEDYATAITKALHSTKCRAVIVIISEESQKSKHVRREVGIADDMDLPIYPIILDNAEIIESYQYLFSGLQYYPFSRVYEAINSMAVNVFGTDIEEKGSSVVEKCYERKDAFIFFGEYPQSLIKSSIEIVEEFEGAPGVFLGSDGGKYVKCLAKPYSDDYTFNSGEEVVRDKEYYFKIEPIKWRILHERDGEALLMCENIIDNHVFNDVDGNSYSQSAMRKWLNSTFLQAAFQPAQKQIIIETTVDNSAESTENMDNPYICENTKDMLFLMSYKDMNNRLYGFSPKNQNSRKRMATDFARCKGAWISMETTTKYCGWYWLRSPRCDEDTSASSVYLGSFSHAIHHVKSTSGGTVPALRIKLQ